MPGLTRKGTRNAYAKESSDSVEKRNRGVVKALIFNGNEEIQKQESAAMPEDEFRIMISSGEVIEPPLNLMVLTMMVENSSELGQVIDAMEINIEGFGGRLTLRDMEEEDALRNTEAIKAEQRKLKMFMLNFSPDDDDMTSLRRKLRRDLELTGNAYLELIPNKAMDKIVAMKIVESHTLRITKSDIDGTKYTRAVVDPETGETFSQEFVKKFRRYVQIRNTKKIYFKDWRDPRFIDRKTGKAYKTQAVAVADGVKEFAHPMKHFNLWSARGPYGLPRYIGNLFSIFGSRASEEINYNTFLNNNVPSMAILVSGNAMLTDGTIKRINEFTQSVMKRSANYSKFLLLEAEPASDGSLNSGTPKIEIERLKNEQHNDQLFQEYDANNADKIRRAYRLPPIFVGRSSDYNRGTAETSKKLAEEQIFGPERKEMDRQFNMIIESMGVIFWIYKAFSTNVTDNQDLVKMITGTEKTGALTPNLVRQIIGDIMGTHLPKLKKESLSFDPDIPFSLTMARELNQGGSLPGNPTTGRLAPQTGQMAPNTANAGGTEGNAGEDLTAEKGLLDLPEDENGDLDTTQLVDQFTRLNSLLNRSIKWEKGKK